MSDVSTDRNLLFFGLIDSLSPLEMDDGMFARIAGRVHRRHKTTTHADHRYFESARQIGGVH